MNVCSSASKLETVPVTVMKGFVSISMMPSRGMSCSKHVKGVDCERKDWMIPGRYRPRRRNQRVYSRGVLNFEGPYRRETVIQPKK